MHNLLWNTQYNAFFLYCLYLCVFKMASTCISLIFKFFTEKMTNFSSSFNPLTNTLTRRHTHKYKDWQTDRQTHTQNISTLLVQKFICKMANELRSIRTYVFIIGLKFSSGIVLQKWKRISGFGLLHSILIFMAVDILWYKLSVGIKFYYMNIKIVFFLTNGKYFFHIDHVHAAPKIVKKFKGENFGLSAKWKGL